MDLEQNATTILGRVAQKRIMCEIVGLQQHSLEDAGIFVNWSEENMTHAKACILGPPDTPYAHGFYFFDIYFSSFYPIEPPKVYFRTTKGFRMHPNLYTNGKVCLSVLNTWNGPQWSSVQTVRSILLTMQSILSSDALRNEPGFMIGGDALVKNYDTAITYLNIKIAIYDVYTSIVLRENNYFHHHNVFEAVVRDNYNLNYDSIQANITELADKNHDITCKIYESFKVSHHNLKTLEANIKSQKPNQTNT